MKTPSNSPLPPPNGYSSWLDYAVATMDTRTIELDHSWGHQGEWPEDVSRQEIYGAARAELAQLRGTPWDACPGIERLDGGWVFTGTKVPVAGLFAALGRGSLMLEEWHAIFCPRVTEDQLQAVFASVLRGLESKSP